MNRLISYSVLLCFMIVSTASNYDRSYPQDYFQLPVNRAILLSGTFGELRPNHFHAGIDIKSANGQSGESIHSAAAGYISRINVQAGSYGNVIYIAHPNGYTTVYAHLREFNDEIAAYVKEKQYSLQQFEVNLFPDPSKFPITSGQILGKLGNSGNSFGPHLHFEIRETATQIPLNPLLFGFQIKDNIKPDIQQLAIYSINDKNEIINTKLVDVSKKEDGSYYIPQEIKVGAWRTAYGIKTYDKMDGTYNRNGIYQLNLCVDDKICYSFELNAISFDETRYINCHIDYELKQSNKGYLHKCYKVQGNQLGIYKIDSTSGAVKLFKDNARRIELQVADANGNISKLNFNISRSDEVIAAESKIFHHKVSPGDPYTIKNSQLELEFEAGTFYENAYLEYHQDSGSHIAEIFTIGNMKIPVHKYFKIRLKPTSLQKINREKLFIAYLDEKGRVSSCGGKWHGEFLESSARSLGSYTIQADTIAPNIKPISYSANMQGKTKMTFQITDNIPTNYPGKGLRYEAYLDDIWMLMEYDAKNDLLTHHFDQNLVKGEHNLKLRVWDDRDNEALYSSVFNY